MNIPILLEDNVLLILEKPAGITVNRSDTTGGEETVQDFVEKHLKLPAFPPVKKKEGYETSEESFKNRSGIVHRLDKETSGILIVAKTLSAFGELQNQFKERLVKKTYIALVHGEVSPKNGEITVPVGRLPWNRMQFGVIAGGRPAVTKYEVVKTYYLGNEILSLVKLFPTTGRTHQIRVHLKYISHPIFGDFLYAGRKTSRNDRKRLNRVFLHASEIRFMHPVFKKEISLESSLPEELRLFLQSLKTM